MNDFNKVKTEMTTLFEKASRSKLRLTTMQGKLTVEDLWDVPLLAKGGGLSLDTLAKDYSRRLREEGEESFVHKTSEKTALVINLELALDILKHIIEVKLAEAEIYEKAVETKAKKESIMTILASKAEEELKDRSVDKLKELLNSL